MPFADLLICLRFFSRLPVPVTRRELALGRGGLAKAAAMAPVAGALLALAPAGVVLLAQAANLPAGLSAPLTIASLVALTGALHEDGLADCADGFGGGRTVARKLEIMRDSSIGTYGATAIALSLYLRSAALSAVLSRGAAEAVAVLIISAALSRAACLVPLVLLPPARGDGMGAAAAQPDAAAVIGAAALACAIAIGIAVVEDEATRAAGAVAVAVIIVLAVCAVAWRQIGGQTGDVAGAAQQAVEAGVLIVFAAAR